MLWNFWTSDGCDETGQKASFGLILASISFFFRSSAALSSSSCFLSIKNYRLVGVFVDPMFCMNGRYAYRVTQYNTGICMYLLSHFWPTISLPYFITFPGQGQMSQAAFQDEVTISGVSTTWLGVGRRFSTDWDADLCGVDGLWIVDHSTCLRVIYHHVMIVMYDLP